MEENNILNKNNKKKILVGSIIIVMVLLLVVVGSTYAYFSLQVNGNGTSTKVTITTGSSKQIKLSGGLEDFHIRLDVKDMAYNRRDWEYYATSDSILPYVTNKEDGLTEIGKVEVIGDLEEKHVCTAIAKVTLEGGMASLIEKGDLELYLESEQYTNKSDLTGISSNYPATLEFVLENTKPIEDKSIKAYLKFTNQDKEQNYLAGKTLNVSIIIEDFKCITDTTAPQIDKIYFNEDTSEQHYTNKIDNILYMNWTDEDVKEYCITQEEDTPQCEWKPTNGQKNISETIQLEDVEKDHLYNGYLKDNAGNISIKGTASIIYDKTLPILSKFYIKEEGSSKYTNQIKNKVYFQYNDTNIKDMCVTEETTSTNCQWTTISESMDYTFANNNEGLKTIYGYVRDKAGNISNIEKTDTITYDITPPTITNVETPNPQETSLTLSITANDNKEGVSQTSGIFQYCYSTSNSGEGTCVTSTDGNITINNLNSGTSYTYYIYAKDNAGNSGVANKKSYEFKTSGFKKYTNATGQDLINDRSNNPTLQNTAVNGLYRYKGTYKEVLNNYICLGPKGNTCQGDADKNNYMYRIIGITNGTEKDLLNLDVGQLKVIKATSIGKYTWGSGSSDESWESTYAYSHLNSYYSGLNSTIKGNIKEDVKWYCGNVHPSDQWSPENYPPTKESTTVTSNTNPIGLMYASDFYQSCEGYSTSGNTDNWLFISHGLSTSSSVAEEWTMTKYGLFPGNSYGTWAIQNNGSMTPYNRLGYGFSYRPVFFLKNTIHLTGSGTTTDPFIINS